jgi:hypothetical protein
MRILGVFGQLGMYLYAAVCWICLDHLNRCQTSISSVYRGFITVIYSSGPPGKKCAVHQMDCYLALQPHIETSD